MERLAEAPDRQTSVKMSQKKHLLRELVTQRLAAAADEVFALIERAFAEYEEEIARLKRNKLREQKEMQGKQGVQTGFVPEAPPKPTEVEQTLCNSLNFSFDPLKPDYTVDKPPFLQHENTEETRRGETEDEPGLTSGSRPVHGVKPRSSSDTDDSQHYVASPNETNASRKRQNQRKRQHGPNESELCVKRERGDERNACNQSASINDTILSADASMPQPSVNTMSPSWLSLLSQPPHSTDTVAMMHEMLAKQDVLLQQQAQIFTLLSSAQIPPECSLDYKDLPLRDHQELTGMEARLQDQDYRNKLINHLGLIGGMDVRDTVFRIMKKVVSHSLAMNTNWRGINGKSPFARLQLKEVVISAVWKNPLTASVSACEVEKYMKRWLQLAIDREGGRRRRANKDLV